MQLPDSVSPQLQAEQTSSLGTWRIHFLSMLSTHYKKKAKTNAHTHHFELDKHAQLFVRDFPTSVESHSAGYVPFSAAKVPWRRPSSAGELAVAGWNPSWSPKTPLAFRQKAYLARFYP